jgi:hypothetical protein
MTEPDKVNPFELINKVDELPPELKKEVMATINFAHLATDIGKLFSIDMAKTAGKMLDPTTDDAEKGA